MADLFGSPKIIINSPTNGSKVNHKVPISGTVVGLPSQMELWVVKDINNRYHPDDGPIQINGNNLKSSAYVGNRAPGSDQGVEFTIYIVEVGNKTGKKIDKYIANAKQNNHWPGIGKSEIILAHENLLNEDCNYDGVIKNEIKVIRKGCRIGPICKIISIIYNIIYTTYRIAKEDPIKAALSIVIIISTLIIIFRSA
jgi:hypothetical protein